MNRLYYCEGKEFRLKETGEVGRLEAPPLCDPGSLAPAQTETTGILWLVDRWQYVTFDDIELVHPLTDPVAIRRFNGEA